jgi:A118 family predicted phage portal protein
MENCVKKYLIKKGYDVNENAETIIQECDNWYANRDVDEFHKRTTVQGNIYHLEKLNFAKRCCSDDANLCEISEVNASKNKKQFNFVKDILDANNFERVYREQLEKLSAAGTVGCYIRLDNADITSQGKAKNGVIRLNYINAENYIPLTVENGEVIEAAFASTNIRAGKKEIVLVIFTTNDGIYTSETVMFSEDGKEISSIKPFIIGECKPFAILKTAEVNNLDDMEGYGLPKILNAIPILKAIELCWNVLFGDLDKADKLLLINELMCAFDADGKPMFNAQQKKLFVMLGDKLPDQKSLIQEYNPVIRIDEITKTFELLLSLLSMMFGYGTKKYSFENGQIKTATEYIGERQDCMQELNKQRGAAKSYIKDIVNAILYYSNAFNQTAWKLNDEITVEFDDSYIEGKASKLEAMRTDALSFNIPTLTIWYLMERYNISEEEAVSMYKEGQSGEIDEEED